jgi:hypothetical protein
MTNAVQSPDYKLNVMQNACKSASVDSREVLQLPKLSLDSTYWQAENTTTQEIWSLNVNCITG